MGENGHGTLANLVRVGAGSRVVGGGGPTAEQSRWQRGCDSGELGPAQLGPSASVKLGEGVRRLR